MNIIILISTISITLIFNLILIKKIKQKKYKSILSILNIVVCTLFCILFIILGNVKKIFTDKINFQMNILEQKANELYPDALTKQLDTKEIKKLFSLSIEVSETNEINKIIYHIIKQEVQKYTSPILNTLNDIEKTENKITIKDALTYIKDKTITTIELILETIKNTLLIIYLLYIAFLICFLIYLSKEKKSKNKSIVFGEESDKTQIGMINDN